MAVQVLTDPDAFFRERTGGLSVLPPAAIVLVVAAIGVVAQIPQTLVTMNAVSEEAGSIVTAFSAVGIVVGFLATFVIWLVYAGIFQAISAFFDGEGGFAATLKITGWGYLPAAFNAAITAGVQFYVFRDFLGGGAGLETVMAAVSGSQPVFLLTSAVGIAFTLWQGVIWTFGIKHARNLELRGAAITVGVPVAFTVLLSLGGIAWTLYVGDSVMG